MKRGWRGAGTRLPYMKLMLIGHRGFLVTIVSRDDLLRGSVFGVVLLPYDIFFLSFLPQFSSGTSYFLTGKCLTPHVI